MAKQQKLGDACEYCTKPLGYNDVMDQVRCLNKHCVTNQARHIDDWTPYSIEATCPAGHVSSWLGVEAHQRYKCPYCDYTAVIPPADPVAAKIAATQIGRKRFDPATPDKGDHIIDIHIERVGEVATASIVASGFPPEPIQRFIESLEGIVGIGNVTVREQHSDKENDHASNTT